MFSNTFKTIKILSNFVYKNPKIYAINIFATAIATIIIIIFWSRFNSFNLYPPMLMNFMVIPIILNMFFLSLLFWEWKYSILFQRLKLNGVSKFEILVSSFIIFTIVNLLSFIFTLILIGAIYSISITTLAYWLKDFIKASFGNYSFYSWSISISIVFMFAIVSSALAIIFPCLFKSKNINKSIVLLFTIFSLVFSDIAMNSQYSSTIQWIVVIGYLSPFKYISWFMLYINSYANIDYDGMKQIVYQFGGIISFSNMWVPSIMSCIFTIGFPIITFYTFNWGRK